MVHLSRGCVWGRKIGTLALRSHDSRTFRRHEQILQMDSWIVVIPKKWGQERDPEHTQKRQALPIGSNRPLESVFCTPFHCYLRPRGQPPTHMGSFSGMHLMTWGLTPPPPPPPSCFSGGEAVYTENLNCGDENVLGVGIYFPYKTSSVYIPHTRVHAWEVSQPLVIP